MLWISLVIGAAAVTTALFQAMRLRALERERELFFALCWDLCGVLDLEGRPLELNAAWTKSLGFAPSELRDRRLVDLVHPEDRGAMAEALARLAAAPGSEAFQNRFECSDGTYKWLSWTARSAPAEGRIYVVARDAGARVRVPPGVEETRNFLDSIIENIPHMVFVKDAADLRFVMFNRAGEELLGRPRETFIGKTDYDFFPKEEADFFTAKDRETLASGRVLEIPEEPIQTANGPRLLHTKKITINGPGGKPAFLLGISEDITERKGAERLRNEVVSLATHELRTPLTSIIWGLDMLAHGDAGALPAKALEVANLSHGSAVLMARMIDDYLDVVKLESGKAAFRRSPVDVGALVEKTLRSMAPFAARFDVKYSLRQAAPGVRVEADPERLAQALSNLLSNAAKFSPAGGTVEAAVARGAAGWVRVSVADRGAGIPEAARGMIFQKFMRGRALDPKRKGAGLGLSIAKAIVEKQGGRIGFETGEKTGTTFYIELPELSAP
jgi:PAS domain S-box-containing protein